MAEKKVKSEMKCPKCGYTCFNMSGGDVECARCGHFGKIRQFLKDVRGNR